MPVMPDRWIIEMCERHEMITPFSREQVRRGVSFGPSSYGYDISLSDEFKLLRPEAAVEIDPKADSSGLFEDVRAESIVIPANSFVLARTVEYFRIPRNILTVCYGKSTYARSGGGGQRDAVRAGVGGFRHGFDIEHGPAAGPAIRPRRDRATDLSESRRRVRMFLRRQEGQVSGTEGNHGLEVGLRFRQYNTDDKS